jgi:uracil-DNA glycosylase
MSSLKRKDVPLAGSADLKRPKKDGSLTSFFGTPKHAVPKANGAAPDGSVQEPTPVKFDKDAWVSSLKPEQKELLKLEIDTLDSSWLAQLKEELVSTDFLNLKRFLQKEIDSNKTVFPPLEEVYSWCVLLTS